MTIRNEQTPPFEITAKQLTLADGGAESGRWMAYTNGHPVLVRDSEAEALRDARYETDPFRCCGRILRSYDYRQVKFHSDRVEAECTCCGEKQSRPL